MKEKTIALEDNEIIFEKLTVKEEEKVKGSGPIEGKPYPKPCGFVCI